MRLAWVHYGWPAESGMARGYLASAYLLRQALLAVPALELVDVAAGSAPGPADYFFHYCPPHFFRPFHVEHCPDVLMTMWEGLRLPPEVRHALGAADRLVVPSPFCAELWASYGFEADVVPLGVADDFLEGDASRRIFRGAGEGLRFLLVGSRANRKAWELVGPAWVEAFGGRTPHQCYVKMIGDGSVGRSGPVMVDQRDLEPRQMLALYRSADVFVSPTLAEGFGLPLLEAMAAGCLAVSTLAGGNECFFGAGRGIIVARSSTVEVDYGGVVFPMRAPTSGDLAAALRLAAGDWGTPEAEAARASGTAAARTFTWGASAAALLGALYPAQASARMPA